MSARNTATAFGTVTRLLHWLTAALILALFPLGMVANSLPYATGEELAFKAQVFSVHKTLGVLLFAVALARILWALGEVHPVALHPDRPAETLLARLVHWLLYLTLVAVPLSGWVHHAAVTGFAPILWPFGQGLPFVPHSDIVAETAAALHWVFTKLMLAALVLHVAGALKHHLIDRDATLMRMWRGTPAPLAPSAPHAAPAAHPAPAALGAVAAMALTGALGLWLAAEGQETAPLPSADASAAAPQKPATEGPAANWAVESGRLTFRLRQMGAEVTGTLPAFTADIRFDETPAEGRHGAVRVTIDTTALDLGAVTEQARGADFFDVATHPLAVFEAAILPAAAGTGGFVAEGTLTLRGITVPVQLPFTLERIDDRAEMAGSLTLDRRAFAMGESYPDEATVGFAVTVDVALQARRLPAP